MEYRKLHEWTLDPSQAISIQNMLKNKIVLKPYTETPEIVAGVDLSFPARDQGLAVIVLLEYPSMRLIRYTYKIVKVDFPYVPGLLVFREGPAFLAAWEELDVKPDVVVFDGQGIAHPRGIGIASHMGLFIGVPTIGVAKSRLYGWHEPLPDEESSSVKLLDKHGKTIGYVLRTKKGGKPIYVSPGHLTDPESALELVKSMTVPGKRIPEPTRMAHTLTQRLKKGSF